MRRLLVLFALAGGVALTGFTRTDTHAAHAARLPGVPADTLTRTARLQHLLDVLADDSMAGRRIGTHGIHMAARFLASELHRDGVQPAGDDGYLQHVPVARIVRGGGTYFMLPSPHVDFDTLPPSEVLHSEANVVGRIPGSDPALARQVVVVGAHYDHLGIGRPVNGDSIYNGADDDGSGTVAVLEIARDLTRGTPPRRTVVVLLSTGEEVGMVGTRWYLQHPVEPLDHTVADLQIEMIGRPDSLAGGPGHAWLTGYGRTTMGDELAAAGLPIVPDPRPDQGFFFRSDNTPFAVAGIPAHTLSTFDLHADYHRPSDEVTRVDFAHMTAVVDAAIRAVRLLADGPKPEWKAGGREGLGGGR
ncbi:MAG: M20/M25/M40 family metallo-hydrolase [Gemmatimonadetes bacterium]|nr:M20/M25/M40 family metallo-hydrolase [Gemmatimonadota bacterium]